MKFLINNFSYFCLNRLGCTLLHCIDIIDTQQFNFKHNKGLLFYNI